ncbi:retinoschisin-like [Patiria miniata]|uniref:F5/8 type C domain-containing protein n=1 Tax=Patiria miniata TaxID=46514 RepID=A0A914A8A5_PATMI|nr:retinoschisin-like [Patiria miniata]
MDGAGAWILTVSTMIVFVVGVETKARVCYFGPPPEPDPDNPDDWMKQVMQEIRESCPGTKKHTSVNECSSPEPLGLEDGTITDDHITASSNQMINPAREGRLNYNSAWMAQWDDTNPWIEVDLIDSTVVRGVITQGYYKYTHYVTHYQVAYQKQPSSVREHVTDENGDIKVFIGNTDANGDTPVTNLFDESVVATVVRIEPTEWKMAAALRLELLGCRLN